MGTRMQIESPKLATVISFDLITASTQVVPSCILFCLAYSQKALSKSLKAVLKVEMRPRLTFADEVVLSLGGRLLAWITWGHRRCKVIQIL